MEDRPAPEREADVLRAALDVLRSGYPRLGGSTRPPSPRAEDAELRLRAPDGGEVTVLVEAKRLLNTRDVPIALEQLQRAASSRGEQEAILVLAAGRTQPGRQAPRV